MYKKFSFIAAVAVSGCFASQNIVEGQEVDTKEYTEVTETKDAVLEAEKEIKSEKRDHSVVEEAEKVINEAAESDAKRLDVETKIEELKATEEAEDSVNNIEKLSSVLDEVTDTLKEVKKELSTEETEK